MQHTREPTLSDYFLFFVDIEHIEDFRRSINSAPTKPAYKELLLDITSRWKETSYPYLVVLESPGGRLTARACEGFNLGGVLSDYAGTVNGGFVWWLMLASPFAKALADAWIAANYVSTENMLVGDVDLPSAGTVFH